MPERQTGAGELAALGDLPASGDLADRGDPAALGDLASIEQIRLDLERNTRRGFPEAILCEPKTDAQLAEIARRIKASGAQTLFTRVQPHQVEIITAILPDAARLPDARLLAWPPTPPPVREGSGKVLVLAAGTSDAAVALEAHHTARYLGYETEAIIDVGVAGLHRLLAHLAALREAAAIVVAAGMDGALASVVAGLVACPVVAVPTSVGYGAAFGGVAPLLSMLNACAPGVAVVNIDNGYGAGHLAAQIATRA